MEDIIRVQKHTELQYSHTRLIHQHRYDSAHLCVRVRETPRCWALDLWCYGLFWWRRPWFVCLQERLHPHRWSRRHPGPPHQAWLFAQVLGLLRRLRQRFLLFDLSTRLGHPDLSLHSSAVTCKKQILSVNAWSRTKHRACLEFLTFQVLVLLAHCPHADLVVDHVDTREAVAETVKELCYSLTWCKKVKLQ